MAEGPAEEVRLEEKANLMKREKPRWRCICNANTGTSALEGTKNERLETDGNEIERPIALANPILNSSPSTHSLESRSQRCATLIKKKILIFLFLITPGTRKIRENHDTFQMLIVQKSRFGQRFLSLVVTRVCLYKKNHFYSFRTVGFKLEERSSRRKNGELVSRGSKESLFTESDYCPLLTDALSN